MCHEGHKSVILSYYSYSIPLSQQFLKIPFPAPAMGKKWSTDSISLDRLVDCFTIVGSKHITDRYNNWARFGLQAQSEIQLCYRES